MALMQHSTSSRFDATAGIAIGPILFIIAILAILAAAIAAGSGSFTSGTSSESNRTKASALIQIGENLKIGMDRMTMENSVTYGSYTINGNSTSNNNDLFSPTGGGITAPSDSLANLPGTDHWYYPTGAIPGLGTTGLEQLAVLKVDEGTCTEINAKAVGVATPAAVDVGDFATAMGTDIGAQTASWPAALHGKTVGCVNNANTTTAGTFFYQVLLVQ